MPRRADRVLFPAINFTKRDVIAYYRDVAAVLLPHLHNRPISFKRYVDTIQGTSFWEKDAPGFTPKWVKRFAVPRREGGAAIEYIVIDSVRTLEWIADVGGIELHPFLHLIPRVDIATHMVFDLDPGEDADIGDCARVAVLLRDALRTIKLQSFAKVSGSKGIQVYVPLNGETPHDASEPFARAVAEEMARAYPSLIVAKMTKAARHGKVFIDWSQNADFKTTVAVYSMRAKRDVPLISMPVRWSELTKPKKLEWTPDEALARIRKVGDLFARVLTLRQSIGAVAPTAKKRRASTAPSSNLPKPKTQSGRRLFALKDNELLLDMNGRFRRWILQRDRVISAEELPIDPAYFRGKVRGLKDTGAYEIIEGAWTRGRFSLWFSGKVLRGAWTLERKGRDWILRQA